MAGRRAFTEGIVLDSSDEPIDLNNLNDEQLRELARRAGYDVEDLEEEEEEEADVKVDSDVDDIDF